MDGGHGDADIGASFEQQYKLTTSVEKETRCRTEWKKEYKQVEDPKTGEMKWRENWVQIEVAYTYTICKVKLVNNMLSHLPFMVLSREKVGMYALYMATLGNYPDLFGGQAARIAAQRADGIRSPGGIQAG